MNTIFFIGPQGSGKGTQAKLLAKRLNFFYWEMGGILREIATGNSILGLRIKKLIDSGILLNDDDLYQVVKLRLSQIPIDQGVIFDGIPRRLGQAEFLIGYLKEQNRTEFSTFYINLPKDESIKRLLKRAELEKRADDTLEKIEFRLAQYLEETVPVLDYLKKQGQFFEIDGSPTIEEITKKINSTIRI